MEPETFTIMIILLNLALVIIAAIVIYKIAKLIINYLRDKHGLDRV